MYSALSRYLTMERCTKKALLLIDVIKQATKISKCCSEAILGKSTGLITLLNQEFSLCTLT